MLASFQLFIRRLIVICYYRVGIEVPAQSNENIGLVAYSTLISPIIFLGYSARGAIIGLLARGRAPKVKRV
jgi:hypothetical protein